MWECDTFVQTQMVLRKKNAEMYPLTISIRSAKYFANLNILLCSRKKKEDSEKILSTAYFAWMILQQRNENEA